MDEYTVIDKDSKEEITVTFHPGSTPDSDEVILDHKLTIEKQIDDYKLPITFTELMTYDATTNIASRDEFLTHNAQEYNKALTKAYFEFEFVHKVYHIFRHHRTLNKLEFSSCVEIGITTNKDKIEFIIAEDYTNLTKQPNMVYTYSISTGNSSLIL